MTAKKAIIIGLLTASIVGLISFGIKTKTFKPKTMQASAEDLQPISRKWILNREPTKYTQSITANGEYKIWNFDNILSGYKETFNKLLYNYTTTNFTDYTAKYWQIYKKFSSNTPQKIYEREEIQDNIHTTNSWPQYTRLLNYTNDPTGDTYTLLNREATPLYNATCLVTNGNTCLRNMRKGNISLGTTRQDYHVLKTTGDIILYLDNATTTLKINGINYTSNLDNTITITNDDVVIETQGTTSHTSSHVFTIHYENNLPEINPTPIPDASSQTLEVLDITGLMFTILTMPFSFISQAFNLTLWEGTPYQFNFSNFILSLIAIATIIFIIKLFTSGFSVMGNYTGKIQGSRLNKQKSKPKPEKPKPETTKKE